MPRKHVTRSGLEKTLPGGNTELCEAAENGSDEKVLTSLWKGASPNATDSTGKTALHLAAMQGFTSIVYKLLDYEASPFICDNSGHTPLDLALERNQREVVNLLHYTMNSSHIRNTYSWSGEQNSYSKVQYCNDNSLISAVRKRKEKFVREAIDAGSSLEERDSEGNTALCVAATMGLHNMVHVLLNHGACVNAKNHYGRTALHMAAMRGVKRIVEILLVNDASPYERDVNGLTPLDLARINNCKKVEKVLQNKLHTLMNAVNNGECAGVEKTRLHLSENEQCLDSLGQAVRSNGRSLEKRNPDPQRKAVEIILPPTEPPQSQDREEPINIEDDFNRFRKIAYIKKQTALIITAQHRARKRRFRLLQERRNYHAAKNYKILLKKYRERKKIHRDRIRQRAGMIKRRTIVQPTHQNTIQRKIEHAVERAIKSGGRRAAYNAEKRAAQFEALLVASLEKKRQVRMITRSKKKKNKRKKKSMVQASVRNFPSMTEQSYGKPSVGPVPKQKLEKSTAAAKTHTTKKNKKTRSMKSSTLRSNSTFVHKPVVSLESKGAGVSGERTKNVTYASLFPKSCVEELPTFEQMKSEMIRQEKKNPMIPTSVKDKYENVTIMTILIEDLLSAARERKNCKIYWKSLKKYKKKRKLSDKQTAADYGVPNVQKITDKKVTDLDLSGSSGGNENVSENLEQDPGMTCIDQNDSILENVKNPTKKERECADKQKEVSYWIPNVQKSTDKVLTDFDISGPSGDAENVPDVLEQDAGTACINRNVSMSKRIMKVPKEKKVKPMDKKETRAREKDNDTNITTKIHLDASEGAIEDVSVQLNGNIDESAFDKNGTTSIHIAARKKNGKDLALILKAGASADTRDKDGRTPLHEAALRGHSQNIRILLQFGASIDVKENKFGSSPLHVASLRCQNECVKTLVKGGADMLIMDARGQTPLHVSAWNGHAACIDTLISLGTPVDTPCIDGSKTALHLATTKGHLECISLLLKKGAAVDRVDRAKRSVVHIATRERQADCLRFLLQNGASVNLKSGNSGSALHIAAIDGSEECISVLLGSGARVDSRGRHFRTPLHVAAERGHHRCVRLLLDGGASVQSADTFMNTPLHLAAMGNHGEAVRLLVDGGASCSAKNNQRKTPLDVAGGDLVRSLLV